MNRDYRVLASLVAVVLAIAGWSQMRTPVTANAQPGPQAAPEVATPEIPPRTSFSPDEVGRFLADAMAAEAVTDPLLRCLRYPDPPDSHWSHAAVDAYCRFRNQPYLDGAKTSELIASGHADELDRRLAEAQRKQESEPESRGLLDHIYVNDFNKGSLEIRASLDAWKRQSPRSAFAFAASGLAYVAAASDARGGQWISETPAGNIEAMQKLLALARADLAAAIELNPRLTPIYLAMISAARMDGDDNEAAEAARAGLSASPIDYAIFTQLMVSVQPKWGGSMEAMRDIAARAQAAAKDNPLMELLLPEPDAYASGICGCGADTPQTAVAYTQVLDRIASTTTLSAAGTNADDHGQNEFALVYLSEALRFNPELKDERKRRLDTIEKVALLGGMGDTTGRALLAEADRMLARAPTDSDALMQLGQVYGELAKWDKAWSVSEELIASYPDEPYGWILRGMVQEKQPRPGLHDTAAYVVAHFADNPEAQSAVARARIVLANDASSH